MQHNEIMGTKDSTAWSISPSSLIPGRQDDGLPIPAMVAQEVIIGQRRRSYLVARGSELLQEINGPFIPARRKPRDAVNPTVFVNGLE